MAASELIEPNQQVRPYANGVSHGLGWPESESSGDRARVGWPDDVVDSEETSETDDDG
jgi:hypothetical protein